ncbi:MULTISPECIES: sulfotransferase [Sphingobium]|uniref:Sulfotransferase n=1 Tax=Sphingobium baderi TaxID=1332080 RepID=A0A0S3F2X7_9SPHN|nr:MULTISPECIES: sulfotransferase [Sphingobium]ALR22019.1 hypothetical protein ATN00_18650 [Sphingobium baderi]
MLTASGYFDGAAIFDRVAEDTSLGSHADPAVRERYIAIVEQFNDFAKPREDAVEGSLRDLRRIVEMRLQLSRDWADYPAILDEEITRPIFVMGFPRGGTTLSQKLLSLDWGHRTPRYMDGLFPSPPPGLDPDADAEAFRAGDAYTQHVIDRERMALVAHPYHDKGAMAEAEDEWGACLDFRFVYPLHFQNTPSVPPTLPPSDPHAHYLFQKNMMRQYQWKRPTARWVGKGVLHHYMAPSLFDVFPDAIGVWCHRPIEDQIASMISINNIFYQPIRGGNWREEPSRMVEAVEAGVQAVLANPMVNDPRIYHLRFADLVKDPVAALAGVYESQGLPFTSYFEQRIRAWLAHPSNKVDRHGRFNHSPEQHGLDRKELARIFKPYKERFGL